MSKPHVTRVRTVDVHVGGQPLRLIVEGCPPPRGATMLERRVWAERNLDWLRLALMHEPRGHADACGAFFTEASQPGSHAGLLFMDHGGFGTMAGHGVIGAVTIALDRGLLSLRERDEDILLDVPAGTVRVIPTCQATGAQTVTRVSFISPPAFVFAPGLEVDVGSRVLRVDVAFGGAFYAIVDGEEAGVPLRAGHLPDLRALGVAIAQTVESMIPVVHPLEPKIRGIHGTIFTGLPDAADAHLRTVAVSAGGQVNRSPSGSGTAAVMAVLDAMGILSGAGSFVPEGIIGTRFEAEVEERSLVGERVAICVRITGSAWVTGEHTFLIDEDDPLRAGFAV